MSFQKITDGLKCLYQKEGDIPDKGEMFIIERFLSFNIRNTYFLGTINHMPPEIKASILFAKIPKQRMPFVRYVKTPKEAIGEFDFIVEKIKKYYRIGGKDIKRAEMILEQLFGDKEKLQEMFCFFGVDKKYFRKYKLEMPKIMKKKEEESLLRFAK